jgi:bifunctional DNA-binding transcriptional regulator/antitoxin component of YhaV-PrlF toxin-antitoxin module
MYKNLKISLYSLIILLLLCSPVLAKSFGAGLSLDTTTSLTEILSNPDAYVGKQVQLKGMIVEVCESRGCWLNIAGDKPFEQIRVKVDDGQIVFPMEARGKEGIVEGVVEKFVRTREEVIKYQQHYAEERGESFDPSTVTSGETFYQLRGLGAEIVL